MELVKVQGEGLTDHQDHIGEEGCKIGIKQAVERASDPVIAEVVLSSAVMPNIPAAKPFTLHSAAECRIHCLMLAIDRLSFDDDRAQQHAERAGVRGSCGA